MVKYKYIIRAIEHDVEKCFSIAQIKEKLKGLTLDEQFQQLKDKGLLNPLEIEDYEYELNSIKHFEEQRGKVDKDKEELLERIIKETTEEATENLFQYNKRLVNKPKYNPIPEIDETQYQIDNQYEGLEILKLEQYIGNLEKAQIKLQDEKMNLTKKESYSVGDYYCGDMQDLNNEIRHGKYLNKLNYEDSHIVKEMDKAMKKSPGLIQDTTLYCGGELFNIHLKPGDHSRLKGYTSTSYQKFMGEYFKEKYDNNFLYIIRAPKGTKGICGNDEQFKAYSFWDEHEYLLPRNTGFTVKDIDYDNRIIEIILDQ